MTDTKAGSLPYREAGERLRLSRARLMDSELAARQNAWKVWAVCMELTASRSKAADETYLRTIATMSRVHRDRCAWYLQSFDAQEIIVWKSSGWGRARSYLALPSLRCEKHGTVLYQGECADCASEAYWGRSVELHPTGGMETPSLEGGLT
jgi:hypothetical protein